MLLFASFAIQLILSQALCSMKNSAIATIVTSNIKDILLTIIGLFVFADVIINVELIVGIVISISGAILFLLAKLRTVMNVEKKIEEKIDEAHINADEEREFELRKKLI